MSPKLASLSLDEIAARLGAAGLAWRTGPFVVRLRSVIPSVASGLSLMYADYPLAEQEVFADFHVTVQAPSTVRRWVAPQAVFHLDGVSPFAPLPRAQAYPMLEWGLNWCVSNHAHGYLMIHAAVLERNGYAAILPAPPGSGKSTLCAALMHCGWRLLSDELTLIRLTDGEIVPLPRPVSLKNESIDVIARYAPDALFTPTVKDTVKGTVAHVRPPSDSVARAQDIVRARWIIFPRYQRGGTTRLQELSRAQGFMRVADNSFNYSLLGQSAFQCLGEVISASRCYDFAYSDLDQAMTAFAKLSSC